MTPEEIVQQAEAAYDALDLERMMAYLTLKSLFIGMDEYFVKGWMNCVAGMKAG